MAKRRKSGNHLPSGVLDYLGDPTLETAGQGFRLNLSKHPTIAIRFRNAPREI